MCRSSFVSLKHAVISMLIIVVFSALTIPVRAETFKVTF